MRPPVIPRRSKSIEGFQQFSSLGVCVLLCFIKPIIGLILWNRYGPGVIPLQGTWGGWILTFHLNYVAGYTGYLLFLFERTHQYSVFLSFFLGFRRPNLITGLSGW